MNNLENIISEIRLSQQDIGDASTARKFLEQIIRTKGNQLQLPTPLEFYIIGSYKRGTKISPLDDIDILYSIGNVYEQSPDFYAIIKSSYIFTKDFYDHENNISSKKVLDKIKSELMSTYTRSDIRRNNEVVNLYLNSYSVGFDIVPAFYINSADTYLIPNGSNSTKWKKTNPKVDERILDNLHSKHNQLLKNVIRIIKYWFKKKKIKSLRSFHLESLAYYIFDVIDPINSYQEGVAYFLNNINYKNYLESCPDPTFSSEYLSSNLEPSDINLITNEAKTGLQKIINGEEEFVNYVDSYI